MFHKKSLTLAAALALGCAATATTKAQDSGALVDALVRKGILSSQEGEDIRADLTKEYSQTNAGKINISSSITELKIYGDFRYRWQYDDRQAQVAAPNHVDQRSRHRFRLRLNADVTLQDGFYAGFALESGQAADSGNQTFENGFDDYSIFIAKAYLGWKNDWFNVTLGKFKNPFYTTDLVWDPDINPQGATESIAFHKMSIFGGSGGPSGDSSKDGKTFASTDVAADVPWELTLVGGQFIFDDNNEFNSADTDASTDAYLFVEQLIATYKFNSNTSITIAPAFMSYTAADLAGLTNENAFTDAGAVGGLAAISGETRQMHIITAPGDVSFKLGSIKTKLYWDFAYNVTGRQRFEDIYQLFNPQTRAGMQFSQRDGVAWLAGIQFGETKKKGDWQAYVNYRETGIASVDPNLNDSDFALGELNTRGFKIGLAYALSDSVVLNATGYICWNLNEDLAGGRATNAPSIAQDNASNIVQLDVNVKF